tara:strand:+ start:1014 stop:1679 length:666 start_codon:yes stop_codon:yes gene_type:complete
MENQTLNYWNSKGKYQTELDEMYKLVPSSGEVIIKDDKELEKAIENVRQINRLYYDFYNNGCCNVVETPSNWCDHNEDYMNGDPYIEQYYEPMVENLQHYTGMEIEQTLLNCGSSYGSYDFPDKDCIQLEKFTDEVIRLSWEIYTKKSEMLKDKVIVKKHSDNLKGLFERQNPHIVIDKDKVYKDFVKKNIDNLGDMAVSKCLDQFKDYVLANNLQTEVVE